MQIPARLPPRKEDVVGGEPILVQYLWIGPRNPLSLANTKYEDRFIREQPENNTL
jgi:hypothetical protein